MRGTDSGLKLMLAGLVTGILAFAFACTLTDVTGVPVGEVTIQPPTVTLIEGATLRLQARATAQDGTQLPVGAVTWSVGNSSLLSISSDGLVEALAEGSTVVRATLDGVSATAPVIIQRGPTIGVTPPSLSFVGAVGGAAPGPQTVAIDNEGEGSLGGLAAIVTYPAGGPTGWVTLALDGTSAPTVLRVSVLSAGLGQGTFDATISVSSGAARNSPILIPVQLRLSLDEPIIGVDPGTLSFQAEAGAGSPTPQVVRITNVGGGSLTGLQALVTPGGWLSATLSRTVAPADLTVRVDPTGLGLGSYEDILLVRSGTTATPVEIPVTLSVVAPPSADLSVLKTGAAGGTVGDTLVFLVATANSGPEEARDVVVTDSLPALLSFVRASGAGVHSGQAVTWTKGNLGVGSTAVDTLWAVATLQGSYVNVARARTSSGDPSLTNNRAALPGQIVPIAADLQAEKTAPGTAQFQDTIQYQVGVVNSGPNPAENVTLVDSLPAGVSFLSSTPSGTVSGSVITWRPGTLDPGERFTTNVAMIVTGTGSLVNVASVTSATLDPDPSNNRAIAATGVGVLADVAVSKSAIHDGSPVVGERLTYDLRLTNAGPSVATNVRVTDTLPAEVGFVSATGGGAASGRVVSWPTISSMPAGKDTTLTVVTVMNGAGTLINTGAVVSSTPDPVPANNTDTTRTTVAASADVALTKTAVDDGTPVVGEQVTYTLTVTNNGPSAATSLGVSDTLPTGVTFVSANPTDGVHAGGVVTWATVPSLAVGGSTSFTVVGTINATGTLTNRGAVTSSTFDPDLSNNLGTASTITGASADLNLQKTGPSSATAGTQATYTVSLRNDGPTDATNVAVRDSLPVGMTFVSATPAPASQSGRSVIWPTIASLANGGTQSYSLTVAVASSATGTLTNVARVSSGTSDPDVTDNRVTAATPVTTSADVEIGQVVATPPVAGAQVSYTLTVRNIGPSNAANVVVRDTLPLGTTFSSATPTPASQVGRVVTWPTIVSMAPGSSQVYTVTADVPANATGTLRNAAVVTRVTADPVPTNDTASVTSPVAISADVALTKSGPTSSLPDSLLTYTLTVENLGPSDATGVVVRDTIPAGVSFVSATGGGVYDLLSNSVTWTVGDLTAAAAPVVPTLTVRVGPATTGNVINSATLTSTSPDPVSGNDSDDQSTAVSGSNVFVTKTAAASAAPGDPLTYNLAVGNAGPSAAANVVLTDTLPVGVTYVSHTGGGSYQAGAGPNGVITWTVGTMARDASQAFAVNVNVGAATNSSVTNVAAGATTSVDPNLSDNRVTTTTAIATRYLVTSSSSAPVAGAPVTITAQLANPGGAPVALAGKVVTWTSTGAGGSLGSATSTTDANGAATVTFTTSTVARTTHTVTATTGALAGTSAAIVTQAGAATKYLVTPSSAAPVAGAQVTITARLADANDNFVTTAGNVVTWGSTNGGTFGTPTSTTDASGVATVAFTTSATAGTAHTVTATTGALTGTTATFTTVAGAATQYLVTASGYAPVAGSQVTITAQLADANGNALATPGLNVDWTSTNGGTFGAPSSTTDAAGAATVTFTTSTVAGTTHTVTATDTGGLTGTSPTITTSVPMPLASPASPAPILPAPAPGWIDWSGSRPPAARPG